MPVKTEKPLAVGDCEVGPTHFTLGLREIGGKRLRRLFELSARSKIDWNEVDRILSSYTVVGYNWHGFDRILLRWCVEHPEATTEQIKAISDRIIGGGRAAWKIEQALDITIPRSWDSVDLIEPQPNPSASLKVLGARQHCRWLQELPYHHADRLTLEQIDETIEYMWNDLDLTEMLWHRLAEPIQLREYLGEIYGKDFRSMSDPQVGENMMKIGVERRTKRRIKRRDLPKDYSFRYPRPAWANFETPAFRQFLEDVCAAEYRLGPDNKVEKPESLQDRLITLGETTYSMGIGGIHSTESNRSLRSDYEYTYVDADVGSQYPKAIISLRLYPESLGEEFIAEYDGLRVTRIEAKRAKNKAKDKAYKIALNGSYGKLGSAYSVLFAPHLMCATTLSCQLSILLLVERLEEQGYSVVSANTDGVLIRSRRDRFAGIAVDENGKPTARLNPSPLNDIIEQWERDTTFELEFNEFDAIYNLSVNSYFAIKSDGGHKRKGPIANPWNAHPDDFDPLRTQLMKNPTATICSDAVLALIKEGVPIAETIRGCRDIRQFVSVVKVAGGATWRGKYLGEVVRYYWGHNGDEILRFKATAAGTHNKVPKTDGCRPHMTFDPAPEATDDAPWALPDDIDYARYEREAEDILRDYGFYGRPPTPARFGRLTAAKLERMKLWLLLA